MTPTDRELLSSDERAVLGGFGDRYGLSERAIDALETLVAVLRREEDMPDKWRRTIVSLIEDSLTALELDAVTGVERVADLGTGCGIPGLVLAAAMPDAYFSLIDRNLGPVRFVIAAAEAMQLGNVEAERTLVEPWAADHRESCDLVVSRNVRPENVMAGTAAVLKPDGRAVLWAGEKGRHEPGITDPDEALGLRLAETRTVEAMGKRRYLFVYERASARSSSA
jgi:16S rRNA (guanine527-N7)-methyltransferase